MEELESLIDAAKRGDVDRVRALLDRRADIINQRDSSGATALHYAAFEGHRTVVEELVRRGADINSIDDKYHATPAGWAIEYMREMGGFLGIELADFAHAVERGDVAWTERFLQRFPGLRLARDREGTPIVQLAQQSGNPQIMKLFQSPPR